MCLYIYPNKIKSVSQRDTCTPMVTATLFTIAMTWQQTKCPSTGKWIKKMGCISIMEYYLDIKKEGILLF